MKSLPTVIIPNLPMSVWHPTEERYDVPAHITIMKFEADGYMLGRDPKYPLRQRSVVSELPVAEPRSPPHTHFWLDEGDKHSLLGESSWDSGSAVWTWSSSNESSMERESVTEGQAPDTDGFGWIASAISSQETTEDIPRAEAWDDCGRIWFALPPPLRVMMDSCLHE